MGPRAWESGVRYNQGDEVKHEGNRYRILQPHTSQIDWAPSRTPALWKKLDGGGDSDDDRGYGKKSGKKKGYGSPSDSDDDRKKNKSWQNQGYGSNQPSYGGGYSYNQPSYNQSSPDDDRERWVKEQQEKSQKAMQRENEKRASEQREREQRERQQKEQQQREQQQREQQQREQQQREQQQREQQQREQQQREQQQREQQQREQREREQREQRERDAQRERDRQNEQSLSAKLAQTKISQGGAPQQGRGNRHASEDEWLADARRRSAEFKQRGPRGPTTWVLVEGGPISRDAIIAGEESDGSPLFAARAWYQGGLHVGKASPKGASISYGGREVALSKFEVLLGDSQAITWVPAGSTPNNFRPVEGGYETGGQALYIAQTPINGAVVPGKAWGLQGGANVGVNGKETHVDKYMILAYS